MKISLKVNGEARERELEPRALLCDFLREDLHLTGTHVGCEHGACGACTVHIDGVASRSCLVLAAMCDGQSVVTVEGVRDDHRADVLRRQFMKHHGLQCGFCTPGMLMMGLDILRRHKQPSEEIIRNELSGQICRCTGYVGIVEAIRAAAEELADVNQRP